MFEDIKKDFPILSQKINGHPLVYLDNAATTQKPSCVLDTVSDFYKTDSANAYRGAHTLSERSTDRYERARKTIQKRLGAASEKEIVFTKHATEAINVIAHGLSKVWLSAGDEIMLTEMEHHSNWVPWKVVADALGCRLVVIPVLADGTLDEDFFNKALNKKTKVLALTHASNVLGTINPVERYIDSAKKMGVVTVIDGTQYVPHREVNVVDLGCDFYIITGHKMFAINGVGVFYGRSDWLERLPPYQTGGGMVLDVTKDTILYDEPPHRFEAGTPNVAAVLSLEKAIEYMSTITSTDLLAHETELLGGLMDILRQHRVKILPASTDRISVVSVVFEGRHAHDVGTVLDRRGIAVRVGRHCAAPLMKGLGISASVRFSFSVYNQLSELEQLEDALHYLERLGL